MDQMRLFWNTLGRLKDEDYNYSSERIEDMEREDKEN